MRTTTRRLGLILMVLTGVGALQATHAWLSTTPEPVIGSSGALRQGYASFVSAQQRRAEPDQLVVSLGRPLLHAGAPGVGQGQAVLDLAYGRLHVAAHGLAEGEHEVWLIDQRGADSDVHVVALWAGALVTGPDGEQLDTQLDLTSLIGYEIDRVVVSRAGDRHDVLLSGTPSLFQRLYFGERLGGRAAPATGGVGAPGIPFAFLVPAPAHAGTGGAVDFAALVAEGERLFFEETFGGNGRTCGTCHPAQNDFTLDPDFIATLPASDPLFVGEQVPELAGLEDPVLLRDFALIRANLDGFDDPTGKFVMRSVSHMLGMRMSTQTGALAAPFDGTGWSGDGAPGTGRLRDFTVGAVTQHFPKTLARTTGVDFRAPTEQELDAMEAFMFSLGRQSEFDLSALRLTDPTAERGRELFMAEDSEVHTVPAAKCNLCHGNAGALTVSGVNRNFDTGVENMAHAADLTGALRPRDGGFGIDPDVAVGGFGDGRFNVQSLWEAADTAPYFHHNGAATLEDAIRFYDSNEFRQSPEGLFLQAFDTGGQELAVEVDALAAFLRVLNTIENVRSANDAFARAQNLSRAADMVALIDLGRGDLEDAVRVLGESELHPDAVALLTTAIAAADQAIQSAQAPRITCGPSRAGQAALRLDDAILDAVVARDLMIQAPIQQLPDPVAVLDDPPSTPDPTSPPDPPVPPAPIPGHSCSVYGCSAGPTPPPPIPGDLPDPATPPGGNSAEGSAFGIVQAVDLDASTLTIQTPAGNVTLQVTTATVFKGSVASNLSGIRPGHEADASFFLVTNEVENLEANFAGF